MGGDVGTVSRSIARRYPNLSFIVQDLPHVIANIQHGISNGRLTDQSQKISFMPHDFLTPQPELHADIFMFRFTMHDWSDKYAVKILQNIVPAMKKSARILVMDYLLASPGSIPKFAEKLERSGVHNPFQP